MSGEWLRCVRKRNMSKEVTMYRKILTEKGRSLEQSDVKAWGPYFAGPCTQCCTAHVPCRAVPFSYPSIHHNVDSILALYCRCVAQQQLYLHILCWNSILAGWAYREESLIGVFNVSIGISFLFWPYYNAIQFFLLFLLCHEAPSVNITRGWTG